MTARWSRSKVLFKMAVRTLSNAAEFREESSPIAHRISRSRPDQLAFSDMSRIASLKCGHSVSAQTSVWAWP
jgi:hypothetical protein